MEIREVTGRTVEESIEIALEQLGADRDQVEIDVVSQGRGGILGFGAEPARIRVKLLSPPSGLIATSKLIVDNLLRTMDASATTSMRTNGSSDNDDENIVEIDIEGDDSGLLIGRRGETLRALQFIVNLIVNQRTEGRVMLDICLLYTSDAADE